MKATSDGTAGRQAVDGSVAPVVTANGPRVAPSDGWAGTWWSARWLWTAGGGLLAVLLALGAHRLARGPVRLSRPARAHRATNGPANPRATPTDATAAPGGPPDTPAGPRRIGRARPYCPTLMRPRPVTQSLRAVTSCAGARTNPSRPARYGLHPAVGRHHRARTGKPSIYTGPDVPPTDGPAPRASTNETAHQ